MPELPEVETVCRGLAPVLTGAAIHNVIVNRADLRLPIPANFSTAMSGGQVQSVVRRGKYILAFLENGEGFVLHLGMSGRIRIYGSGDSDVPVKHDHVVFNMGDGSKIVFNDPRRFGMLYLTRENHWQSEAPFSAMGPEPLGNGFNAETLQSKLKGKKGPIKNALLDQRVVAGLGNIYVCEALYDVGVHPARPAGMLSDDEAERLTVAIREILLKAIDAGGSTLKDHKRTDGSMGYFQFSFSVYDRAGQHCPSCGPEHEKTDKDGGCIQRIVQSGRSTFFCPVKQV